jgi:hypothetical protein
MVMVPPPAAVLAVAGLAVAGFKMYNNVASAQHIAENALERYEDEKLHYYEAQKDTLKTLIDFGRQKLTMWESFHHLVRDFAMMQNQPNTVVYRESESFYAGKPQIDALAAMCKTIQQLQENHWDELGTGLFTSLAIYGSTMTQKVSEDNMIHVPGFPGTKTGSSILDTIATSQPPQHSEAGMIEEGAALAEVASIPTLYETKTLLKKVLPKDKQLGDLSKEEALQVKDKIDWQSLKLADAVARLRRIEQHAGYIKKDVERLYAKLEEQFKLLDATLAIKTNYLEFTQEEKNNYMYTILILRTIRLITRIDLLLKRAKVCVINSLDVHDAMQRADEVVPVPVKPNPRAIQ